MKRELKRLLVQFFRSFPTEVIKNIVSFRQMIDYTWDQGVRFQGEVEVSFDSRISCT